MSTETKHTPGPWLLQETTVYALNDERVPVNRFTACIDSGWRDKNTRITREEVQANARLISAAPELLEALEDAVSRIRSNLILLKCDDEFIARETEKARAAIAKARGQ